MYTPFRSFHSVRPLLLAVLLLAISASALIAQENAPDTARIRVFVFAWDAPAMDVFLNEQHVSELATMPPMPWFANDYRNVAAGDYTISFTAQGGAPASPLFDTTSISLQPGHDYTAAVIGLAADDALQMVLIDETAALEGVELNDQQARIRVHAVYGAPSLDFYIDDELVAEDVAFGEYFVSIVPGDGGTETYFLTETGNPEAVFIAPPPFPCCEPDVYSFSGISGKYPGEPGPRGDYAFMRGTVAYTGDITTVDAGSIPVGETLEITLDERGSRNRYQLTLDAPMTLDITLLSRLENTDPMLRIYDETGEMLYSNDEITITLGDMIFDAGFESLALPAGNYTIEAASYGDLFPGTYWLSVFAVE